MAIFKTKKGQMLGGPVGPGVVTVFGLFFIGILIFAFALAGGSMISATDDTTAQDVINKTVQGASDFADFSPVLWIMAAIAVLLAILIGSIGIFFFQRS